MIIPLVTDATGVALEAVLAGRKPPGRAATLLRRRLTEVVLRFQDGSEHSLIELAAMSPMRRQELGAKVSARLRLSGYGNACINVWRGHRGGRAA